ncbi:PAS domain-containing protein [Caenimonas terrae]|uniref:PAS domain-containing protein n=1 Tax=Caenimonas terrae TaxID=696074 RepID=A0ABW0NBJ3_9BURK
MPTLPSFRQLLILLTLGCVLPMAGLALGLVAYEYQRDRRQLEHDTIATARALMAAVDDHLDAMQRAQGLVGGDLAAQGAVEPVWLRDVLLRQKLPATWIAAVLDQSGRIVSRTHEAERFVGTPARAALIARIRQVPEDAVESVTVDGVPVITAFSRSERTGWSVAIGMPREELQQPILRSTAVLLGGTGMVMLLTLWLAWRMAGKLSASIDQLGGAMRAAGHNVPVRLPEPVFREAHQLGQALLHATASAEDAVATQRRLEARMHSILDTAQDAILTADDKGRVVLFNCAAERMFRLPRENAIGMTVESLVPTAYRAQHRQLRESMAQDGAHAMAGGRVIEGLRSDGSTFRAEATVSVAPDEEGRLYTVILRELPP